ncbi:MAG TPA: IPT/TIG domain-containing protein [Myxococcota bacterium]|nr:IPT/TIG domain-containing protein [Myxococcota bacterium]HQK51744.1 IPT/TIG domain-containing protein [Myxococcota bacterium]
MPCRSRRIGIGILLSIALGCGSSPVVTPDVGDPGIDLPLQEVFFPDTPTGEVPSTQPPGHAAVRFLVDDTANQTYRDGQMKWTGSFRWSAQDRTIVPASSWLPTDGPFPPLYDDGPVSQGGHEPEGSVKGDHRFEVEVFVKADEEDLVFEYGVLDELDHWIWVGPNGTFTVPRGSEGVITAAPLVFPPFGEMDLKITLDTKRLAGTFAGISPDGYDIFLKSSANSWTPKQLTDDGSPDRGDDVAGDGVFTFVHSKNLGPHDGLLYDGQHAQFVFVFALQGLDPESGQEYKDGTVVLADGVQAFLGQGGTFQEVPIVWERAARGREFNTTVIVGGGRPWCHSEEDCYQGVPCDPEGCRIGEEPPQSRPTITEVTPPQGPLAGGTLVTLTGTDFREGCTVTFGGVAATTVTWASATEVTAVTPPHAAGSVEVRLANPDGGAATGTFTYSDETPPQSQPRLDLVDPSRGPIAGGTTVTITGRDFREGCTVRFGEVPAATTTWRSATEVQAVTPPHAKGAVDVTLTNPDGGTATYPGGFTYVEPEPPNLPDWGRLNPPWTIETTQGDTPPVAHGEVYEPGITDTDGGQALMTAEIGRGSPGSDPRQGSWTWSPATWVSRGGDSGNNGLYEGTLDTASAGTWAFTFRFSRDGGAHWTYVDQDGATAAGTDFSPSALGLLTVSAPDPEAPKVTAITPDWSPTAGSVQVVLTGTRLAGTNRVTLADDLGSTEVVATSNPAGTEVSFTAPAHRAGVVNLSLTNGAGKTLFLPDAFSFVPRSQAPLTVDGNLGDWDPLWKIAEANSTSSWGTGNRLEALWVAVDDQNLYLAMQGTCESDNAIVAFLDRDFGQGTGLTNLTVLTDGTGALDNALSCGLTVTVPGFGADKAMGTKGMASFTCTDPGNQVGGDAAGWRDLATPADLGWDCGQVTTGTGVVEAQIPLATFFGGSGIPAGGRRIAIVVRLVNHDGFATSDQALPAIGGETFQQNRVVVVPVR